MARAGRKTRKIPRSQRNFACGEMDEIFSCAKRPESMSILLLRYDIYPAPSTKAQSYDVNDYADLPQ
ncbi:hypothetical protein FIU97_04820 [Roseivivax sp. THAF40]|uniref:hypothetical protein n=1 Tax=unclassified Roseivivax TaxID=2639302 RepID=UPI0012686F17|nr:MULTISPECIES: hypothetical protein [unclassified Roseivivax]QFS82094.1 hypothetical protein FIV09_04560 [Roseivivax sp. THAF197b]QFT45894.1 hypothetical protein FIU97_04820 [Roseivivax sp. THAF40]